MRNAGLTRIKQGAEPLSNGLNKLWEPHPKKSPDGAFKKFVSLYFFFL